MKRNILSLAMVLIAPIAFAMEQIEENKNLVTTGTDYPTSVNTGDNQFTSYFHDLDQEKSKQHLDQQAIAQIPLSLFKHLCVQAQQVTTGERSIYVKQLATKLRLSSIKIESNVVYITPKDLMLRLLTAVPTNTAGYSLVNGKRTKLDLSHYQTEQDKQENELLKRLAQTKLENKNNQHYYFFDEESSWEPREPVIRINDLKRSGLRLTSSYNFESDPIHHASIVAAFDKLNSITI